MIKKIVKLQIHKMVLGVCLIPTIHVLAQDATTDSNFKLSGYISVVGGKVLSGKLDANYTGFDALKGVTCPCYIADWGNAGVYGNSFSFTPESRMGLQGQYIFNSQANVTAQLVSRGTHETPDLAWAYGSYKFNNFLEVQVGRKRIPLYYYSDFQDIGVAYTWIAPPPELYGWEATNYNGASLRYTLGLGDTDLTASVFGGKEKVSDSLYHALWSSGETEVQWNNIKGVDLEVVHGPITVRAVAMRADVRTINPTELLDEPAVLSAHGLAVNLDFDKWFVLSEFTELTRDIADQDNPYKVTAPAWTVGAGLRMGKWTPFINVAQFTEETTDTSLYDPTSYKRTSFTLRYDISSTSAVKAQIDRHDDITNNFSGDVTVFRLSYDRVF